MTLARRVRLFIGSASTSEIATIDRLRAGRRIRTNEGDRVQLSVRVRRGLRQDIRLSGAVCALSSLALAVS